MNYFKAIFVVIIVAFGAIIVGFNVVTAQDETVGLTAGICVAVVCFALGRRVWLLIPFLGVFIFSLPLPGKPNAMLIAQMLVLAFCGLLFLTSRLKYKIRMGELEVWMLLILLMVAQVYARNPVGLNVLGGSSVGAKPYIIFAASVCTGFLLAWLIIPAKELKWAVLLSIVGSIMNFAMSVLGWVFPVFGYYTGTGGRGVAAVYSDEVFDPGKASRIGFLGRFGERVALWVSAYKSPLMASFHPLWAPLIVVAFVAAGMSGFRNDVAAVGLTFLLGIFYHGGLKQVFASALVGILCLAALAILNLTMPLPPNVQRSLSFLPGSWDQRLTDEAADSTDWRVEIWEEVILTDRWIENKFLGDGLGFTAKELEYQLALQEAGINAKGVSGFDAHREFILANADYHSGPIQTVRVIGYLGLIIFLAFQFRLAVHAHRQIVRCKGTEWYVVSLFMCIPLIWFPVFFIFIYGEFASASVTLFIGVGMVRMLENNLPLAPYSKSGPQRPENIEMVSMPEGKTL